MIFCKMQGAKAAPSPSRHLQIEVTGYLDPFQIYTRVLGITIADSTAGQNSITSFSNGFWMLDCTSSLIDLGKDIWN